MKKQSSIDIIAQEFFGAKDKALQTMLAEEQKNHEKEQKNPDYRRKEAFHAMGIKRGRIR